MSQPVAFRKSLCLALLVPAILLAAVSLSRAEPATVRCVMAPDATSARIVVTNPLATEASCQATCTFETAIHDDKPRIVCTGPVAAKQESELCVMRAKTNPLLRLIESSADCRKL